VTIVSTHILDVATGLPAAGVPVTLSLDGSEVSRGETDGDGRLRIAEDAVPGTYVLRFDTRRLSDFYPSVSVEFVVDPGDDRYHVPLLISPFGYTTYRGS
jgi:5-hydroxyisourate hydrolase